MIYTVNNTSSIHDYNNMKKMANSRSKKAITSGLISAVRKGNLEKARELINSVGLSHSEAWSGGYVLLCDALKNGHTAVAKLLLTSGSKVNIKSQKPTDTPLHFAVKNGNIEIVKMILDKGADVDAKNEYGQTPLHVAAEKKCLQIVEHLLDNGANVNCECTGRTEYTPLHIAVERGYTEVITLLLSRGANVNAKGEYCITPLHIAVRWGYQDTPISTVEDLLNHGASVHSKTFEKEYTPLHYASERGKEDIVKLFLNRGADINDKTVDGLTPLHIAIQAGRETMVKLLLQHGAKVDSQDKYGKTILFTAVQRGNSVIVEDVLKYCPDINNRSNRSSLKIAVQGCGKESEKISKALLEYGLIVKPEDANDAELFHRAVQRGSLGIIEHLLKYGADVNAIHHMDNTLPSKKGFTPLHGAVSNKHEEVAKFLISHKADINAQDRNGETPLFLAIKNIDSKMIKLLLANKANVKGCPELLNRAVEEEWMEIIEALLQHGADINAGDEFGTTALHFTAPNKSKWSYIVRKKNPHINIEEKIAKLLLSKGANVNAQTKDGVTTLHAATENEHVGVVEALLEYNANVNCRDKSDNTPLHHTARKGNKDISIMLLDKGANVNAKQMDGITPLHLAAQEGHGNIVKVLLERGAKVDSKMKNGMTPLHLAAEKDHHEIVETLLKFGTEINSTNEDGKTALHIASENAHEYVVATLLKNGSDINITSKKNRTAYDYATDGRSSFYRQFDDYDSDNSDNEYDVEFYVGYRYVNFDDCPFNKITEAFKRHMVKLNSANLYVSEKNLRLISSRDGESDFQFECDIEIARMKNARIINPNFSFHDILTKDTSSLAMYMRNEKIAQILESYGYERAFPIYASMIRNYFRRGMKKYELLEQGHKSFDFVSKGLPKLPYDCTERIISYLSDEDFENLIDARKPLSISNSNTNIDDVAIIPSTSQV